MQQARPKQLVVIFQGAFTFADKLCHASHGAYNAPGTRLIQQHQNKAQNGGGEHHAVKAERKLSNPRRNGNRVRLIPRQAESPQQSDHLLQIGGACKNKPCRVQHLPKHYKEECQKSIAEPMAFQPFRHRFITGKFQLFSQNAKQLSASAIAITVRFVTAKKRDEQGNKKAQKPQPCKKGY